MALAAREGSEQDACRESAREPAEVVTYGKEDEVEPDEPQQAASTLWPTAADGHSGMRGKPSGNAARDGGATAAPYRLLTPIGTTAYGRAYRAEHLQQSREVALHYLPLSEDGDSAHARELPLLVAKCAQLSHHNVIAVEEYGRDEKTGAHFVVTEPLDGVSLATVLEDAHTLPLHRALALTMQMGRALRAAHKLGIVHGALSPANVRVAQTEHGERVRVVGFGALLLAPQALRPPSDEIWPYEAPECARGAPPDARSDVYAIASLLFRMLTGHAPGPSGEPARLSAESVEPVPRALEELLARCLDPLPDVRVPDIVTFVRMLREVARTVDPTGALDGRPSMAIDSSVPPLELPAADSESSGSLFGGEPSMRRSGFLWIGVSLVLALLAVWLLWRATPDEQPLEPEPRGER